MKISLAIVALALAVPAISFAQDSTAVSGAEKYPNTFSSGSANVSPFTNKSKRLNDWAISAGVGVPLVQSADLTSIKNGNGKNGWELRVWSRESLVRKSESREVRKSESLESREVRKLGV